MEDGNWERQLVMRCDGAHPGRGPASGSQNHKSTPLSQGCVHTLMLPTTCMGGGERGGGRKGGSIAAENQFKNTKLNFNVIFAFHIKTAASHTHAAKHPWSIGMVTTPRV